MKQLLFYDPDNAIKYDDVYPDECELTDEEIREREMDRADDIMSNMEVWGG